MRALFAVALVLGSPALSAPLPTTDQNPLLNGFLLNLSAPARLPAADKSIVSATLNWSNTAVIQDAGDEHLIVDAESRELRLSFAHALSDRLTLRLQLPYRWSDGGSLDGFVDNWHALFGLPNGDRPALPQDDFRIDYDRANTNLATDSQAVSGIGDISIAAGYQLSATPKSATSFWLHVKAPTGDSTRLTGSGGADVALSLAHEQVLSSRWRAYAQLNATYLGEGELLSDQQRDSVWSGLLTVDYCYSPSLTLTMQFDGHTAAYADSDLDFLGDALIMTLGGEYRWQSRWYVQLGVSEDIKVEASPDVNFVLSVGKGL